MKCACSLALAQWMMYYVYVLKSLKNGKRYVGFTGQNPKEKTDEHNSGATLWTSGNRPFELVRVELFQDATKARKREKFLKSGRGRRVLDSAL